VLCLPGLNERGAMTDASMTFDDPELRRSPAAFRTVVAIASRGWEAGSLTFVLPSGRSLRIQGRAPGPDGRLIVREFRFVSRVLANADIGFAEGFMAGEWDTPDLSCLLEAFTINLDRIGRLMSGNPITQAVNFIGHALNRNSRIGSRRNIHAHYDLGNAFYARWLDPTMTYSSARFERPGQPLSEAQRNKYASLAREIGLGPDNHVLEIGCGWGGFAEFAAKEVGARVTGVTISPSQFEFAKRRLFEAGLADKTDILLTDYRDVQGQFDRVASIEMFEAVGEEYWPAYFRKVRDVLSPGGRRSSPSGTSCSQPIAGGRTSSRSTSFPAECCPARPACAKRRRRRVWNGGTSSASARTTLIRWRNGPIASRGPGTKSASLASMSVSGGCGASI